MLSIHDKLRVLQAQLESMQEHVYLKSTARLHAIVLDLQTQASVSDLKGNISLHIPHTYQTDPLQTIHTLSISIDSVKTRIQSMRNYSTNPQIKPIDTNDNPTVQIANILQQNIVRVRMAISKLQDIAIHNPQLFVTEDPILNYIEEITLDLSKTIQKQNKLISELPNSSHQITSIYDMKSEIKEIRNKIEDIVVQINVYEEIEEEMEEEIEESIRQHTREIKKEEYAETQRLVEKIRSDIQEMNDKVDRQIEMLSATEHKMANTEGSLGRKPQELPDSTLSRQDDLALPKMGGCRSNIKIDRSDYKHQSSKPAAEEIIITKGRELALKEVRQRVHRKEEKDRIPISSPDRY